MGHRQFNQRGDQAVFPRRSRQDILRPSPVASLPNSRPAVQVSHQRESLAVYRQLLHQVYQAHVLQDSLLNNRLGCLRVNRLRFLLASPLNNLQVSRQPCRPVYLQKFLRQHRRNGRQRSLQANRRLSRLADQVYGRRVHQLRSLPASPPMYPRHTLPATLRAYPLHSHQDSPVSNLLPNRRGSQQVHRQDCHHVVRLDNQQDNPRACQPDAQQWFQLQCLLRTHPDFPHETHLVSQRNNQLHSLLVIQATIPQLSHRKCPVQALLAYRRDILLVALLVFHLHCHRKLPPSSHQVDQVDTHPANLPLPRLPIQVQFHRACHHDPLQVFPVNNHPAAPPCNHRDSQVSNRQACHQSTRRDSQLNNLHDSLRVIHLELQVRSLLKILLVSLRGIHLVPPLVNQVLCLLVDHLVPRRVSHLLYHLYNRRMCQAHNLLESHLLHQLVSLLATLVHPQQRNLLRYHQAYLVLALHVTLRASRRILLVEFRQRFHRPFPVVCRRKCLQRVLL